MCNHTLRWPSVATRDLLSLAVEVAIEPKRDPMETKAAVGYDFSDLDPPHATQDRIIANKARIREKIAD